MALQAVAPTLILMEAEKNGHGRCLLTFFRSVSQRQHNSLSTMRICDYLGFCDTTIYTLVLVFLASLLQSTIIIFMIG
jgi:hypothetical protein